MGDRPIPLHQHEALRSVALRWVGNTSNTVSRHNVEWLRCEKCWPQKESREWQRGKPERHAPDCLAAPDALTKGDEG